MNRLYTALIVASLLAIGCSKPEDAFVSKYTGKLTLSQEALDQFKEITEKAGQGEVDIESELNKKPARLELLDDGTFVQSNEMGAERMTTKGKWTLSDDGKTITFSDYEALEANKDHYWKFGIYNNIDQVLDVSEDGKSISYLDTKGGMGATVTFSQN